MIAKDKTVTQPVFWAGLNFYQGLAIEALGKLFANYFIICLESHPIIDGLRSQGLEIFCLEEKIGRPAGIPRNTGHLLAHPLTQKYIKEKSQGIVPAIVCFKSSPKIEAEVNKNNWRLVANPTRLNRFFEDKINFLNFAKGKLPLIPGEEQTITSKDYPSLVKKWLLPFVIQLGRGWAGKSSFLITSKTDYSVLFKSRPLLKAKISPYIQGKTYIVNGCILADKKVLVGPIANQITGLKNWTNNPLATCGRQWPARLPSQQQKKIVKIAGQVGRLMAQKGCLGFFGPDFLVDQKGKVYLVEVNPRLTASFVFYTQLEARKVRRPLLSYHLGAFLKIRAAGKYKEKDKSGRTVKFSPAFSTGKRKVGCCHPTQESNNQARRRNLANHQPEGSP